MFRLTENVVFRRIKPSLFYCQSATIPRNFSRLARNITPNKFKSILPTSSSFEIENKSSIEVESRPKPNYLNVAIIGKPNTGKSTLFNRITKSTQAIVSDVPGTTRDRRDGIGSIAGLPIKVVDTGGFDNRGSVTPDIKVQIEKAIQSADVILFMLDAKSGINSIDQEFAKWVRKKAGKLMFKKDGNMTQNEIIILANKTEGAHLSNRVLDTISEAYHFGLGDPIPISAIHGDGMSDLGDVLFEIAKKRGLDLEFEEKERNIEFKKVALEDRVIQIAIMGRPNVGKSSLLNAILGEERVITGPVAGLTRDAIPVSWSFLNREFRLVDTAGLTRIQPNDNLLNKSSNDRKVERERGNVGRLPKVKFPGIDYMDPEEDPSQFSEQVSELALQSALNALKFAQVVLLVVEGDQGRFSKIDLQLAAKCLEEGRALIIVANKRDLVALSGMSGKEYEEDVKKHCEANLREFGNICVVSASATEREGINRILKTMITVHDSWSSRISTWLLNRWVKDTLISSPKPRVEDKRLNVKYMTQIKARPPTFALFCNTNKIPESFERFLKGRLQHDFKLEGIPIRMIIRKAKGTMAKPRLLRHGKQRRRGIGMKTSRGVGPKNRSPQALYRLKKRRMESRILQKRVAKKRKRT